MSSRGGTPAEPARHIADASGAATDDEERAQELATLRARRAALEAERQFFWLHSRNLEREVWRLRRERARTHAPRLRELTALRRLFLERGQRVRDLEADVRELEALQARVRELEKSHQAILSSWTWRIGSWVLAPYHAVLRKLGRL